MHQEERQIGSYRLHTHLEHGTIADAYLATHIHTNKQVVVKVFQDTLSAAQLAQCLAFIRNCARLEHPAILRLLDFGEQTDADTSTLFLAIDAPGETLRQRHPQGLPLPLDTIALYVSQIATTLQFAHDQQILHLNLSPEQLFTGPDGTIMLDFTSRLLYSVDPTFIPADALYTPHEPASPASDQYALAALIYEWLSGSLPFSNSSESAHTQRVLSAPGDHTSTIWLRVKPILKQALALNPTQRYQHIKTFVDTFLLTLNVGTEAARRRQEMQRQFSSSGSTSFTTGASISMTGGYRQTDADWYNPFSVGFSYTTHSIHTLALSSDSKRLAFNTYEPAIYIAAIAEAEQGTIFIYQGHSDPVSAVVWSPDGQNIASISSDQTTNIGTMQVWEVTTGKLLSTYNVPSSTDKLQWSPDGKLIATGGWDSFVHILQPFTGKTLLTYRGHSGSISAIAWSPDSTRIASASANGIQVWNVATGALICTYRGHFGGSNAVAWSPDGSMLASGGDDTTIQIWNATTRIPIFIHRFSPSVITTISWSLDSNYIITGTRDGTIQVCDVTDGVNVFQYYTHLMRTEHINSVAWSPDLSILAIGGDDHRVEIANRATGTLFLCRASITPIEKIGQSEVAQDQTMTISNTTSISNEQTTTSTITTTTTAPSRPPVVHMTTRQQRTVRVWGGKDARDIVTYFGHKSAVGSLAWSPDSTRIASGGYDGNIHTWDAVTSTTIFIYRDHLDPVTTVAWSPDGTRLASGSLDHTAKIWDLLTGREILTYRGHNNFVHSIAWSPDSTRMTSGSEDNTVQAWDASSGETILTCTEHTAPVTAVDWAANGQHIASGSADQTVHIWDAANGNNVFVYRDHPATVLAVSWSPDCQRIASSNAPIWQNYAESLQESDRNANLHIWTPIENQTATIYGQNEQPGMPYEMSSIAWSPDGQMLATQAMPHARIYDTNTGEVMATIMPHHYNQSSRNQSSHNQPSDRLLNLAWSPDGTRIAGCFNSGMIQIWPARAQF